MKSVNEVIDLFKSEFKDLKEKFNIIELSMTEAFNNGDEDVNSPGVYVYWHHLESNVVKVGKHQQNSKKRSLQHISDNTHNSKISMGTFKDDHDVTLILLNIKDHKDLHGVLSLEAFMEWRTNPIIKSKRMG